MDLLSQRKQEFNHWYHHPQEMDERSLGILFRFFEDYPASSFVGLLLLKNMHILKHPQFEEVLPKVSIVSPDRAFLHQYVHADLPVKEEVLLEEKAAAPAQEILDNPSANVEDSSAKALKELDLPKDQVESLSSSESLDLEKLYLQEAVSTNYLDHFPILDSSDKSSAEEVSAIGTEQEKESIASDHQLSFIQWLEQLGEHLPVQNQVQKQRVLDFVQKSQKKAKSSFYSASEMAQKSLQEEETLVTETLANIYVAQKNYSKAIQAFEKLSLLFPEKKPYFAGRIKEIKQLK